MVDLTCTDTKWRVRPTTKSKLRISPQGLLIGKPSSMARVMKTVSAHSPRSFLLVIVVFCFFRFFQSFGLVMPLPQNEKGGIRGKLANPALWFYSTGIKSRRQEKLEE